MLTNFSTLTMFSRVQFSSVKSPFFLREINIPFYVYNTSCLRYGGSEVKQCRRPRFDPWIGKIPGKGNGNPLQYPCLENPKDRWTTERLHFYILFIHSASDRHLSCLYFLTTVNSSSMTMSVQISLRDSASRYIHRKWNCWIILFYSNLGLRTIFHSSYDTLQSH